MILNRVLLNTINVNQIHLNKIGGFGKAKGGVIPPQPDPAYPAGCIHRSKNYGRSNDDADRDIIKDLSGTGTDIILYNVGYAGNSGFGLYEHEFGVATPITVSKSIYSISSDKSKVHYTYLGTNYQTHGAAQFEKRSYTITKPIKVEIKGLTEGITMSFIEQTNSINIPIEKDGIYTITVFENSYFPKFVFNDTCPNNISVDITIKLIPDYKGALVSDGVDDYGLCENFPILTKEKGYTMLILRDWILRNGSNQVLISDNKDTTIGEYILVNNNIVDAVYTRVFGTSTSVKSYFKTKGIVVCSSSRYNDFNLSQIGETATRHQLRIFRKASVALYALEIYDHDLTDEEIQAVKSRMIREYEEGTGLPYDEAGYFKLNNGKLDIDKLK